jgi:phage terminase large subunit-like protein
MIPSHVVRNKSDEAGIDQGDTWRPENGERIAEFLERFIVLDTGKPFTLLPYQRYIIDHTYNWIRADGRRRKKVALATLGRKNGKTALTYGLTAYMLLADGETSPSCISCAVDKEQASQIFNGIHWSIQHNEELSRTLVATPSHKLIKYPNKNGYYKSVASDAKGRGKYGHGHSFVVYDEMAFHKDDSLWTALQNSGDAKPNSLQFIISSAGWNKNGCYYRLYSYAKKVMSGEIIDPTFAPFIWETPDEADLDSEATWAMANPALGTVLSIDDFRAQWARAKQDVAGRLDFLRLKFNSFTESQAGWLPVERWEECKGTFPAFTKTTPVYIGLDAGATQDLTAIVAVFVVDGRYYVRSWGIVPEAACLRREKQNLIPYERFTLDKSLHKVTGDAVGIEDDVYPILDKLIKDHTVKAIILDKWQTLQLAQHYEKKGQTVYRFTQGHTTYNDPCKALERAILDKKLVHDGNSLLRWQIGHCELDRNDKGYVMPCKPGGQESAKIDNVAALIMAMSQAVQHSNEAAKPSVYSHRGVFAF